MAISTDMVRRATAAPAGSISRTDGERILEVACLAVVSDGTIAPEELAVLQTVGKDVGPFDPAAIGTLVQRASSLHGRDAQLDRLRAVAGTLSSEAARHLAYKVSVLTAMADLASSDEEFEFDLDLQDALELDGHVADRLAGEVHEAVTAD